MTIHLPAALWHAVQALAPHEGNTTAAILRALEEYVTAAAKNQVGRSGKCRDLVKALSLAVTDLHLSARPASTLQMLNIRYVYELVQQSPTDLFALPNFWEKSRREIKDKLAKLGLTLGMTLEEDAYRAAVVAAVAVHNEATRG